MPDHLSILFPASTTLPTVAKDVVPSQESSQNETNELPFQLMPMQFKFAIGAKNDPLEDEADATAGTIVPMPEHHLIRRKCNHCEEEEKLQRKPLVSFVQKKEWSSGEVASEDVSNKINAGKGNGNSMDSNIQTFMQSRFGADFSEVKIHTGGEAEQMNRELNAKAFTIGNDIYFNSGNYNTESFQGKHLLAHELAHVTQNSNNIHRQAEEPGVVRAQKALEMVEKLQKLKTKYGHNRNWDNFEEADCTKFLQWVLEETGKGDVFGRTNAQTSVIVGLIGSLKNNNTFRMDNPLVGDIIMWGGHAGIVTEVVIRNDIEYLVYADMSIAGAAIEGKTKGQYWLPVNDIKNRPRLGSGGFLGFWTP